jgi:hypothetical protein
VEDAKEYARAVLASAPVACDHQFHFFVDQTERRCNRCGVIESKASAPVSAEILFWYRPRSDGGYEGPIHNDRIEDSRKLSGSWVPLVARRKPDQDGHVWDAPRPSWMEGGEGAVEMAREDGLLPASAAVDPAPAAGDGRRMMRKKLTPNQRRVLENLAAGRRADSHCVGRSQFGGLTGTLASLRRAELIDLNGLTDAGREAISPQQTAKEKHDRPQTPCQRRPSAVAWSWSVGLR